LHGEALAIADRALNAATQSIAWSIGIPAEQGMTPIVVFNPHAWPCALEVQTEFGRFADEFGLLDDQGRAVAVQRVQSEATAGGRNRLSFIADLPPLGYRVYRVVPHAADAPQPPATLATDTTLENALLRLTFDSATGYLTSLYDKRHALEALAGPAAVPVVLRDESDTWSHNVFSFRDEVGRFTASSVRLVAHGPVKSVVRVIGEYGASKLIQDFTLYAGRDLVEVSATVDWREQFKALKLRFPIHVHFHRATSEVPYGSIERFANGEEEPGQSWVDLSGSSRVTGERYGVSIINDSKHSYDVQIRDIGLTVLRSPIYAHHDPAVPERDRLYTFIDQGVQRFRYAIYPHASGWEEADTVRRAAEFNQPPLALIGTYHLSGTLPQAAAFATAEPANVVVTVLKGAEDGDDLVVRAYESARTATRAIISLPQWQRSIAADFGPSEIKTFRVPRDPAQPPVEVDLLEWEA
jgi:alpha-mannosidase